MIIVVANLKGGTTKTTSAAWLAHALCELGLNVLIIDADEQGSMSSWAALASGWKIPVKALVSSRLHVEVIELMAGGEYDAIVIDTPPVDKASGVVASALRVATHVVVPIAPTPAEYERMGEVAELVADAAALNRHNRPARVRVLMTRTVPGAGSTAGTRAALTAAGWRVLRVQVGRLERYSQSYGSPIVGAMNSAYGDALNEIMEED